MQTSQGKPSGTGRCLAKASPRWLLKRGGQRSPPSLLEQPPSQHGLTPWPFKEVGGRCCGLGASSWVRDPWGGTAHSQGSLQQSHRMEPAQVWPLLARGGGRQLLAMGAQCLGHRIAAVARKGGTSHFLKYNQRPHHYFPGADTVPLSWSQVPSEAGWPGSKPGPGMSGFGASSSRPGNSQERPWPGLPTPGSLRLSLTWAVPTFW